MSDEAIADTYPEAPLPEEAFTQYYRAFAAGNGYTHLHPCVQQAIADVYEHSEHANYLSPRGFWQTYDEYWYRVWQSNIMGRIGMVKRFPVIPATWETSERVQEDA